MYIKKKATKKGSFAYYSVFEEQQLDEIFTF